MNILRRHKSYFLKIIHIGGIWRHSDANQNILSKKELMYQLDFFNNQPNLMLLLALGQKLPDYSQRLLCAALKFELIGSMVFAKGLSETGKPELKTEEVWWAGTYHPLIESAVKNAFPQYCGCTSIWDAYNRKVTSRSRMLEEMDLPDELIREIALEEYYSLYIMDVCPEALGYE